VGGKLASEIILLKGAVIAVNGDKEEMRILRELNADTVDHVIPRCLYPESTGSLAQRLTVPACEACNKSWSDDEAHFRTIMTLAGEANAVATELWAGKVARSFRAADGKR
jgi:hypothetical protein